MKTTILTIQGMHCDGCAHTIEALLARVPGVRKAEASFDERQARILHDENGPSEAELVRSEEHTSELQSLMRISYAVFCLKKKRTITTRQLAISIRSLFSNVIYN